jgi:hypothetical protein
MSPTLCTLHVRNLTGLLWLRNACTQNLTWAEHLFGLRSSAALFYRDLADMDIEALSAELDLSIFVPRFDAVTLIQALEVAAHASGCTPRSDLELHNLASLQALRDDCLLSAADAVWAYRMDQTTAEAYRRLDYDQVIALSKSLDVSALLPRYDPSQVARILSAPSGARASFAAAYESDLAAQTEAARRSLFLTH